MTWTFMVIAMWLKSGVPEPHVVTLLPGAQCTNDLATAVWRRLVEASDHADMISAEFDYSCEQADAPVAPQHHVPAKDET